MAAFQRPQAEALASRLLGPRRFIQVVAGPRQVGKTTLVEQVVEAIGLPVHWASGDEPTLRGDGWIEQQWDTARTLTSKQSSVLVIDEVQKAPRWSETVKRLWDEDSRKRCPLRVVLLGSAPLLIQDGLTESLAGRFELIPLRQWSYREMRDAFGWSLDTYMFHGGYPGAAALVDEADRWQRYIRDALVETTISRDVLLLTRVHKPALLRRLFEIGCRYSGRELSLTKILGQLQDAGNTVTLAHYLQLLDAAGMVLGLHKYAGDIARQRASIPKLQVHDVGLMTALDGVPFAEAKANPDSWGRIVESAVGAHLVRSAASGECELFYWRDGNHEVDFVVRRGKRIVAIEVKSGRRHDGLPGMHAFSARHKVHRQLLVGTNGIAIDAFLLEPVAHWFAD